MQIHSFSQCRSHDGTPVVIFTNAEGTLIELTALVGEDGIVLLRLVHKDAVAIFKLLKN